ncbi:hypothetical protein CF319_g2897 [Tilletia indica]|nr:hypothetical protein CF319_g2897 [Tilletia indica]
MSLFTRKSSAKKSSVSVAGQPSKVIAGANGSKSKNFGLPEYDFATLKASGRSKTNFRPVQHSTIAELDSFFGGTSSTKQASEDANRFKDPSTGKVWYDSIDYQEWKTLLHSGSPATPPSRRSSSTSFLASPEAISRSIRSRSIQSPLAGGALGLGLGSTVEADGGGMLSSLSETICCYDYGPFFGSSVTSPRTPSMGAGFHQRQRSRSNSCVALPLLQSTLAGGIFTPVGEQAPPVTLDLASTSPFWEQDQSKIKIQEQQQRNSAPKSTTTTIQSQTSRSLRAALGLTEKRTTSSSSTTKSASDPKKSANRRLSASFFSGPSFSKPKSSTGSQEVAEQHNDTPPSTMLRSPLPEPETQSTKSEHRQASVSQVIDPRQAQMIIVNSHVATPLIQPVPSRAERFTRSARKQRHRVSTYSMLRRSSSADMIGTKSGSVSQSGEGGSSSIQEDVIAQASLTLQRLEVDEGRAASALSHVSRSSSASSSSLSQPQAMIRLPPVLPLLQRRFERLHQEKEGQGGQGASDAGSRMRPSTAGSI